MFSIISTAFGYLLLLIIVVTPVGQWLLLSSSFWTAGMEIIFYFVDNDYPDKVVAFVSAIVAILFVYIVRVIWNVLPPLVDLPSDDEAVCAVRPVASAAAGKYGMSHQDFLVESASFFSSSVSGLRPNHTDHEYRGPVGGSSALVVARPNLIMPETDTVFASLSLDGLRMPEVEKKAYHGKYAKNVLNASNCVSRFLPVDKQLVAVPCPAAVADALADASWRSDLAESNNVSLSSVSRSTDVSDGGFVASASNAADMTKAVDADVSCSSVAGSEPLGDDTGVASTTASSGADDGVVAAFGGDDTEVGAVSGDAMWNGDAPVLGAVCSGVVPRGASSASSLVSPIAVPSCTILGQKRMSDEDFAICAHQKQAKKYKVAPFSEAVSAIIAAEAMDLRWASPPSSPMTLDLASPALEPMDICMASHPPSPKPMDLSSPGSFASDDMVDIIFGAATTTTFFSWMDLDAAPTSTMDAKNANVGCPALEPCDMDMDHGDVVSFFLPAAVTAIASNAAAFTPTPTASSMKAPGTTAFSITTTRRYIARSRALSRRVRGAAPAAAQRNQQTPKPSVTTVAVSAVTAPPHPTTTAIATSTDAPLNATNTSSSSDAVEVDSVNDGSNKHEDSNSNNTERVELEEFDLDPTEILDSKNYSEPPNDEYDEFEGFDFAEGLDSTDRLLCN